MDENVVQGTATPARAVTFFDVDGTLMWRDEAPGDIASMTEAEVHEKMGTERPTQAVYGAIARLRAQGHAVFICTGRPYFLINEPLHELAPDGFICQAGAYACVGDTVIRDLRIPRDTALEAAAYLWREGIDVTLESNEGDVALYASDGACFFPGAITVRTPDELIRASEGYRFSKIATSELSPELLARIRPFFEGRFRIDDMQFDTYEFSPIDIDKGRAITDVLDHLGHGRARTFAFGDSENDLSMARAVETFVAMGNALSGVKAAADYVTDDVRNDGVVSALAHFGLI